MVATDMEKQGGAIKVTYHLYKDFGSKRPCVWIRREESPHWFGLYKEQFNRAWDDNEKNKWNFKKYPKESTPNIKPTE